jgi:hypothetical protein
MVVRGVVVVVFGSMGGVCGVVGGMGDEGGGVEWLELAENGRFGGLREVMMMMMSSSLGVMGREAGRLRCCAFN